MSSPNLFIVGQGKSGTSALYFTLRQHPDIYMSSIKEPCHFCGDLIVESDIFHNREQYYPHRNRAKYLNIYDGAKDEKILGEASTIYIFSRTAAEEISSFNPEAKILIFLREPVSYLISLHNENYRKSKEDVGDFESAIRLDEDRKNSQNVPPNAYSPSLMVYSERIKYQEQVARYFDRFGRENTKVIIYEDFRADNEGTYEDILTFLGLDPNFTFTAESSNVSGMPRSGKFNTMIMSSPIKKKIQDLLPHSVYSLFKPIGRKLLWKKERPSPLDEAFKLKLMKQFKPEVIKIGDYLGLDLVTKWGYDKID